MTSLHISHPVMQPGVHRDLDVICGETVSFESPSAKSRLKSDIMFSL